MSRIFDPQSRSGAARILEHLRAFGHHSLPDVQLRHLLTKRIRRRFEIAMPESAQSLDCLFMVDAALQARTAARAVDEAGGDEVVDQESAGRMRRRRTDP